MASHSQDISSDLTSIFTHLPETIPQTTELSCLVMREQSLGISNVEDWCYFPCRTSFPQLCPSSSQCHSSKLAARELRTIIV